MPLCDGAVQTADVLVNGSAVFAFAPLAELLTFRQADELLGRLVARLINAVSILYEPILIF